MNAGESLLSGVARLAWRAGIELSAQAAIAIALVLLAALALRRAAPRVRYALWLVVLLRLALPLPLSSPLGLLTRGSQPPGPAPAAPALQVTAVSRPAVPGDAAPETRDRGGVEPLPLAGLAIWAAGASFLAALALVRSAGTRRAIRRAARPPGALRDELAALARNVGLKRLPEVRVVGAADGLSAPAVFGLVRPVVLLPAATGTLWTAEERRAVLMHELVHLRRLDHLVHAVQAFVRCIYFFHPLVWLLNARLAVERELACDDEVVGRTGRPRAYARALLRLAENRRTPALAVAGVGMAERPLSLPRRLERMTDGRLFSSAGRVRRSAAVAAAVLFALASIAAATSRTGSGPRLVSASDPLIDTEILYARAASPGSPAEPAQGEIRWGRQIAAGPPPDGRALRDFDRDILFRVRVDREGRVREVERLRGAEPEIDRSYRRYVRSFRFEPATLDGEPVEATMLIRFAPARRPGSSAPVMPGTEGVSGPWLDRKIEPVYPKKARDAGIGGKVILRCTVDRDGWTREIEVLRAPETDPGFTEAAIAAVSGWRYRPALLDGAPVESRMTIAVSFTLSGEKESAAGEL
ncbi:MAG: TonB family protein [Acidobacteria bacterium]|nr:MAG: TonB family protein [Acidobacteriota bacterium]